MSTIVERDSSSSSALLVLVVVILLVGGGLAFAYMNGLLGTNTTVFENNKTVENKTFVQPSQTPPVAPDRAPDRPHDNPASPDKPVQTPTR